jgi:hypothetical protein
VVDNSAFSPNCLTILLTPVYAPFYYGGQKNRSEASDGVEPISLVFAGYDWCKKPRGFSPEFTKTVHNTPLLERFFRLSMVVLLNIEGKCSCLRAKPAHF